MGVRGTELMLSLASGGAKWGASKTTRDGSTPHLVIVWPQRVAHHGIPASWGGQVPVTIAPHRPRKQQRGRPDNRGTHLKKRNAM